MKALGVRPFSALPPSTFTTSMFFTFLVVLIIEVVWPMNSHCGSSVDLPRVTHPSAMWQADRRGAIVIAVFRDGKIFFANDQIAIGDIAKQVQKAVPSSPDRTVYLRIDVRAKYSQVERILDEISKGGINDVAFLVNQARPAQN